MQKSLTEYIQAVSNANGTTAKLLQGFVDSGELDPEEAAIVEAHALLIKIHTKLDSLSR